MGTALCVCALRREGAVACAVEILSHTHTHTPPPCRQVVFIETDSNFGKVICNAYSHDMLSSKIKGVARSFPLVGENEGENIAKQAPFLALSSLVALWSVPAPVCVCVSVT